MEDEKNQNLESEEIENREGISNSPIENSDGNDAHLQNVVYVQSMFENCYLDYASYKIL